VRHPNICDTNPLAKIEFRGRSSSEVTSFVSGATSAPKVDDTLPRRPGPQPDGDLMLSGPPDSAGGGPLAGQGVAIWLQGYFGVYQSQWALCPAKILLSELSCFNLILYRSGN